MLEGYLRRKEVATSQNSGRQDVTLRSCIHIISLDQHDDCWARIIDEVDLGKPVQEVLEMAAGWLSEHREYWFAFKLLLTIYLTSDIQ